MLETISAVLHDRALRTPEASFLRGAVALSYGQLEARALRLAAGLKARGLREGERVAIAAPNLADWLCFFFAATHLGAIVVTLNVRYRESELVVMLNQSGTRLVLCAARAGELDFEALYAALRPRLPTVEQVLFFGAANPANAFETLLAEAGPAPEASGAPDSPAVILYTSGTTGEPRGATLTHRGLLASARAEVAHLQLTAQDVLLGIMPLNHVGGLTCTILSALIAGASVVLEPAFSPDGALEAIEQHAVTWMAGVPTMYTLMLARLEAQRSEVKSLRTAVIGGANASPALCEAIARRFPLARLVNLYGLSESSGAVVMSDLRDDLPTLVRSLGVPLQGVEVRVVDEHGAVVAAGADGELQLRGACLMSGYWHLPGPTAEVLSEDGWLSTGDMVTREPGGHLVLRGRKKEMFIQGGYNVYPVEVENVLASHPAVAVVAGIGVHDQLLGEVGLYCVQLRPGAQATEHELRDFCAQRLADYKVPRHFAWPEVLPLTPAGKVSKSELKKRYG